MKNPKPNPEIEVIRLSLCKKLGYLPGDKIPNSRVSIELGKIDATATLIYAKTLNRPVRMAKEGECQYTIELEKERAKNPKIEEPNDRLLSAKQAAKILNVPIPFVNRLRKNGSLQGEEVGKRFYYKPEEVERVKIQRAIDKL
ncbi:helix-turn-helix domain-containing protein [Chryseobacterium sp. RRHN12]|uniref:helix-turn-helix domain-containing protein n=1 Tax=Chryseobacterium sp. RRHN12 TaxID=3437884 RepID=UPI003D9AD01F